MFTLPLAWLLVTFLCGGQALVSRTSVNKILNSFTSELLSSAIHSMIQSDEKHPMLARMLAFTGFDFGKYFFESTTQMTFTEDGVLSMEELSVFLKILIFQGRDNAFEMIRDWLPYTNILSDHWNPLLMGATKEKSFLLGEAAQKYLYKMDGNQWCNKLLEENSDDLTQIVNDQNWILFDVECLRMIMESANYSNSIKDSIIQVFKPDPSWSISRQILFANIFQVFPQRYRQSWNWLEDCSSREVGTLEYYLWNWADPDPTDDSLIHLLNYLRFHEPSRVHQGHIMFDLFARGVARDLISPLQLKNLFYSYTPEEVSPYSCKKLLQRVDETIFKFLVEAVPLNWQVAFEDPSGKWLPMRLFSNNQRLASFRRSHLRLPSLMDNVIELAPSTLRGTPYELISTILGINIQYGQYHNYNSNTLIKVRTVGVLDYVELLLLEAHKIETAGLHVRRYLDGTVKINCLNPDEFIIKYYIKIHAVALITRGIKPPQLVPSHSLPQTPGEVCFNYGDAWFDHASLYHLHVNDLFSSIDGYDILVQ